MALHHEFQGSDVGLALAIEWSAGGDKYPGPDEIEYKWRSFTDRIDGVTFATVVHMAKEAGADIKKINAKYNDDGSPKRSVEALLTDAQGMTTRTDSSAITALVKEAHGLSPVDKGRVLKALKQSTGTALGTMNAIIKEERHDKGEADDAQLAQSLITEMGAENVLSTNGGAYRWSDSGVWRSFPDEAIRQQVQRHVKGRVDFISKSRVDSITSLFKTEIYRQAHTFDEAPEDNINVLNGELALKDGAWTLMPHVRKYYRTAQVPHRYDPNAKAPRFTQFLEQVFHGDEDKEDKKQAVLEMMGYSLHAHCRFDMFAILIGEGANGKSVLLSVLEGLLGKDAVAGVQPAQMDNRFQRGHLDGKLVNIVTELKQGVVIDDESLKAIVTGETSTAEHKYGAPFEFKPFATCWFGTNHMPHTRDISKGLFRRALIIRFNNTFEAGTPGHDPKLREKLRAEMPGILTMALNAYAQADARGVITTPKSSKQALNDWRLDADQVSQFVEDACERDDEAITQSSDLYHSYEGWAREQGIRKSVGQREFKERLARIGVKAQRKPKGVFYQGIRYAPLGGGFENANDISDLI